MRSLINITFEDGFSMINTIIGFVAIVATYYEYRKHELASLNAQFVSNSSVQNTIRFLEELENIPLSNEMEIERLVNTDLFPSRHDREGFMRFIEVLDNSMKPWRLRVCARKQIYHLFAYYPLIFDDYNKWMGKDLDYYKSGCWDYFHNFIKEMRKLKK